MESWKPKIQTYNHKSMKSYGRIKANAPCRKHPKHIQSPGVCSLCLNHKLSKLTATLRARRAATSLSYSSSSSSSSYISSLSSSDASADSSPVINYMASRGRKSTRVVRNLDQQKLEKSRSMAFVFQRRIGKDEKNVEIKRGFWSKLLPRKSKTLMYSRTRIGRVTTAV